MGEGIEDKTGESLPDEISFIPRARAGAGTRGKGTRGK